MFSYFEHRRACAQKQQERREKIANLSAVYSAPSTDADRAVLSLGLRELVEACSADKLSASAVLEAYGKRCLQAHIATNCLADVMFENAERANPSGKPLAGVPVSIKDVIDVAGCDTTLGYSCNVGKPKRTSAPVVRLLEDSGALLYAKTTCPTGLLSFETDSDIFGLTTNPYNSDFSVGASTGGGAALVAYQGSMIELGTDFAGSVRFPAANLGLCALRGSAGRFPEYGCHPAASGLPGLPTVPAPLARNLDDLEAFWERFMAMKPWTYDASCIPLPWRSVDAELSQSKPRWGVIWDDGIIPPTPACRRALAETIDALKQQVYEVEEFSPPNIPEGIRIGFSLMAGARPASAKLRTGESLNAALSAVGLLVRLPYCIKLLYGFLLRLLSRPKGRNDTWAMLVENSYVRSTAGEHEVLVQLEAYKQAWHDAMQAQGVDFILTTPHPLPPIPKGTTGDATLISASNSFIYSVLDVSTGLVPVTFVDKALDALPDDFHASEAYGRLNDVARGVFGVYDARAMHGLPLGVQIIGGRLQEEKVMAGMKIIDAALRKAGGGFVPRDF